MPTDDWSPALDQFGGTAWAPTVTGVALGAPLIDAQTTTDQVVVITGRGKPGATIEFVLDGVTITRATTVSDAGVWEYQFRMGLGAHKLRVRQHENGLASDWSGVVNLFVEPGRVSAWGSAVKGSK